MNDTPQPPVDKPVDAMDVAELADAIRYHNWRYFSQNAPEISDWAFDRLTRRLAALEPDHPVLSELTEGTGTGDRVFHGEPMLSLDKAYDAETVAKWFATFEGGCVESPKVDGVAASLRYDDQGRLTRAVTRGDGRRGEVFTDNARFIAAIPQQIPDGPIEVRGEIFMPLSVFEERFAGTFANPRNTTAGAIKQKEPEKTAHYGLSFFCYSTRGRAFDTVEAQLAWVASQGIPVVEHARIDDADAIQAGYDAWLARRAELDFETDGVVYLANRLDEHERLGETAHHPRYAIAYKFQGESGVSTLVDVEWSVSRSGAITPVAIIAPITLSGATVTRCSLHNLAIMEALGASIGAEVVAMRRGGVIPHIEAVVTPGPTPVEPPATCPVSGHDTVRVGDVLMCSAPDACPAAILGTLEYWCKALRIEGLGQKTLTQLYERGMVKEPADFFGLNVRHLVTLDRMGEKLARKLVDSIQAARRQPLPAFLRSLGADDLGGVASVKLAETFETIERVLAATEEEIAAIYGMGELTAQTIRAGLDRRADLIAHLREHVTVEPHHAIEAAPASDAVGPFAGKSVVFTGKLASMDRKSAQEMVKAAGGATPSDVSGSLDFLVIGDDGSALLSGGAKSSKHKKADKLVADGSGLQIISETAFRAMLEPGPAGADDAAGADAEGA